MNDLERAISQVPRYARDIVNNTHDPFDAVYNIEPSYLGRIISNPNTILNPRTIPHFGTYNDMPDNQRIYLVDRIIQRFGGYQTYRTPYEVAGDVRMNLDSEIYHTLRTDSEQSGETNRADIWQSLV
jgi:hypothetical protein